MNPRRTTIAWGGIDRPPIRNSSDCWPPTRLKIWFASIPNAFRWEINQPGLLEGELVARYIHRSMDRPEPRLWARPNRFSLRHWKSPKWIFTCIDRSDYLWRYVSPVEIDRVFYLVSVIPFAHLTPLLFFFFILIRANLFRRVSAPPFDFEMGDLDFAASSRTTAELNLTGTKFVRKNLLPVCTSFCLKKRTVRRNEAG